MEEEGSGWLKPGYRISIRNVKAEEVQEKFYFIKGVARPISKYVYKWSTDIAVNTENGPENITDLEPGRRDILYQVIFGIKPDVYIYVNLPADTRLGGIAEEASARSGLREIGAITQDDSPWDNPDFCTEMFLQKDTTNEYPHLYAYNPTNRSLRPVIKFLISRIELEEIKDTDTLDKMRRRQIIYRPIQLGWRER